MHFYVLLMTAFQSQFYASLLLVGDEVC